MDYFDYSAYRKDPTIKPVDVIDTDESLRGDWIIVEWHEPDSETGKQIRAAIEAHRQS